MSHCEETSQGTQGRGEGRCEDDEEKAVDRARAYVCPIFELESSTSPSLSSWQQSGATECQSRSFILAHLLSRMLLVLVMKGTGFKTPCGVRRPS